ncbi:MAG: hypothetical protein ACRDNF_04820 [Streptosporangiaceae bacterium]
MPVLILSLGAGPVDAAGAGQVRSAVASGGVHVKLYSGIDGPEGITAGPATT